MSYAVTLDVSGMAAVKAEVGEERLKRDLALIHRKLAFMSLALIIRTCSVDTGRARAGFLALFRKHGISVETDFRRPPPGGNVGAMDSRAISEGEALGRVDIDDPLLIQIANAVEYVQFINSGTARMGGTGFIDKAILKTMQHAKKVLDWYVSAVLNGRATATDDPRQGPGEIPA